MTKQSSVVVEAAKRPKRNRAFLPILGLTLAILLGIVAYGVSIPLVKYAEDNNAKLNNQFDDLRTSFDKYQWYTDNQKYHKGRIVEIVTAAVLWFVMMGTAMLVVSASVVGTDPDRESWQKMGPSPADKKKVAKQLKKDLKEAKKRERKRAKSRKE
jgi:hypothetical protein